MKKFDQNPIPAQAGDEMADPVGESTEKLLSVSKARRWVIVAALLYTLFILFHVVTKIGTGGHTQLPFAILIFSMFAVGRLAYALYGTWNALLYCLAQLIPGVGVISLFVLDWRATTFLKTNNARVGLWGDDPRPSPR